MDIIYSIIDFIIHIDVHLTELVADYGTWCYAILFLIIFCETGLVVTPFLPGDSLLFMAGALIALPTNDLTLGIMLVLLYVAAIAGDASNYTIGHFFGKKLFSNKKSKIFKQKHLQKTEEFYAKYGGKTIFLARFVPIVRTFAPFVAGMGKMSYKRFAVFNVTGGIVWVSFFILAGYFFGNFSFVQQNLKFLLVAIIIISVIPAIIEVIRQKIGASKKPHNV